MNQPHPKIPCGLQIPHPCPVHISRLRGEGLKLDCSGCKKPVYDMRSVPDEELQKAIQVSALREGETPCMIFSARQLPAQQSMGARSRILFRTLVIASWLGFSVQPLLSQSTDGQIEMKENTALGRSDGVAESIPDHFEQSDGGASDKRVREEKLSLYQKMRNGFRWRREWRKRRKDDRFIGCPAF